jgi:hypothetical protein
LRALQLDHEVKADLGRILIPGGAPAYFIVGMLVWEDAVFVDSRGYPHAGSAAVELSVTAAVAGSTGIVLPNVDPKLSFGGGVQFERGIRTTGFSEGSRIFAFEYRTVRRRFYSLSRDFTTRLGGYGANVEKDSMSSEHSATNHSAESAEDEVELGMDEEDMAWMDVIDDGPEIEQVANSMNIAFDI